MAEAQLLETNREYRQLVSKHHEFEDRLHELSAKHHLSDSEQLEEGTLKKRKLLIKDQMEAMARLAANGAGRPTISV